MYTKAVEAELGSGPVRLQLRKLRVFNNGVVIVVGNGALSGLLEMLR